jgi:tetratricopeptide (TPR) repeat protein
MAIILLSWTINFLICFGLGFCFFYAISKYLEEPLRYDVFRIFWLGLIVLVGVLQVYSLFSPVNFYALLFILLFAIAGYILAVPTFLEHIQNILIPSRYSLSLGVKLTVVFTLGFSLLYLASQSVNNYDTYLYHYNAVRWAREYPAVPGLVHIQHRLGFNSSFFLIAALNDIGPMAGTSSHTIVSFLIAMIGFHWIYITTGNNYSLLEKIFVVSTAPFIICKILLSGNISSLSTDLPTSALYLIYSLELLRKDPLHYIMLAGLSACLISFKLSGLASIVVTVILLLLFGYKLFIKDLPSHNQDKKIILLVSCCLLIFLSFGFISRNAIISGWVFFPVPLNILNLHLPWSANPLDVKAISDLIKSSARTGFNTILGLELGFIGWFFKWLSLWKHIVEIPMLAISIVILILNLIIPKLRHTWMSHSRNYFALLLLVFFSFLLWFYGAPLLRFGSIYFFVFFALVINPTLYLFIQNKKYINTFFFLFSSGLILIVFLYNKDNYPNLFNHSPSLFSIDREYNIDVKKVSIKCEDCEFDIYTPNFESFIESLCGNSPIPCTMDPAMLKNNCVKLREPGNYSKGFIQGEAVSHEFQLVEIRNYYESEKYYKLGSKHEQKGETELALQQYEKSSILMPKAMNPLKKLSGLYTKAGNYDKAISAYIRLLKIYPRQYTYDYNIACLYALKDDKQNSTTWLKKAIDKGYRNWVLIQNDKDLDNIRDTTFYHDLMKRR